MKRVDTIIHKGKKIIYVDLSDAKPTDIFESLKVATKTVSAEPLKSVNILTNVHNATYNQEIANAIKKFVSGNTPYIKASAIIGAEGIRNVLLNTVSFMTRREIKSHKSREEALNWLVEN